jgi:hypothetical protein
MGFGLTMPLNVRSDDANATSVPTVDWLISQAVQSAWAPYQSALGVALLTLALTAPPFFSDSSVLAKYRFDAIG